MILCLQITIEHFSKWILCFLCILRKKYVMKLIFCMQVSMKVSYKLILWFLIRMFKHSQSVKIASLQCLYNTLKKKLEMKLIFCMQINSRFPTSWYLLLMSIIKHSQSSQSNKFTISLQHLKKEVRDGVYFLHADKHESFYKLALSFLMEWSRHVQSTQNRKLVKFLQYLKKKCWGNFFLYADKH